MSDSEEVLLSDTREYGRSSRSRNVPRNKRSSKSTNKTKSMRIDLDSSDCEDEIASSREREKYGRRKTKIESEDEMVILESENSDEESEEKELEPTNPETDEDEYEYLLDEPQYVEDKDIEFEEAGYYDSDVIYLDNSSDEEEKDRTVQKKKTKIDFYDDYYLDEDDPYHGQMSIQTQICDHPYVDSDNICGVCNRYCQSSSANFIPHKGKKKRESARTIMPELQKLPIGRNIIEAAEETYVKIIETGKRKRPKGPVVYFCVLQGYLKCGKKICPFHLASTMFKMTKTAAEKAIDFYSSLIEHMNCYVDPQDLIRYYAGECLKKDPQIVEMIVLTYQKLIEMNPDIKDCSPRSLIAGFIYYCLISIKETVDIEEFSNVFGISSSTILSNKKKFVSE